MLVEKGLTSETVIDLRKDSQTQTPYLQTYIQYQTEGMGVSLTTVSKLAGHAGIETTACFYVNSSRDDKIRAVSMLIGRENDAEDQDHQ